MGKLYNPSKRTFTGPWFIDKTALEELHEIVEFANNELEKSHNEFIEATALKDFEDKKYENFEDAKAYVIKFSFDTIRKDITLISNDESKLKDKTIKELLVDPKNKNFSPKELSIDIEYGGLNKFSFNIKQRYDGELQYDLNSTKSEIEDEINYKLENWIDKYKPPFIQSLWLKYTLPLSMLSGIICLIFALKIFSTYRPNTQEVYKDKIESIIKNGVNNKNQSEAVDLLLKINSGYVPPEIKEKTKINEIAKRITIISLAFFLIGMFKPITLIGIGKDINKLKLYKRYIKFVLFVIPAIFIYPYIVDLIKNLF
jgi:hypothetical protein